jgi:hypothetical protein
VALPARPRIIDPACGDGAFLRYALDHAIAPRDQLDGCELDSELVAELAAGGLPGVRLADGLAGLDSGAYDLVIGNPPFGVATSSAGAATQPSEVRFLVRALELARPGGLVALVLPSGVLANERLRALRDDLLARCAVLAVVELPRATFRPTGTDAACSILVLRKSPAPPEHQVLFGRASRAEDLPAIAAAYQAGAKPIGSVAAAYWLAQGELAGRRMDAHFWQPAHRDLLGRLAARHALRPLGELLDRRQELIAGDHVRRSRGEAKGPGHPYEYYQTREFMAAGYNYARLERCDERAFRRLGHTAVRRGDVLVSCAGVGGAGRGRVCLITHQPGASCTGDVLTLRPRQIDPVFLFLFLRSRAGREQLLRLQNGVGTVNLSVDELLQVELPLVAAATQAELAASYAPIADAHHAAMAALQRSEAAASERERARSEALLAALVGRVEGLLGL